MKKLFFIATALAITSLLLFAGFKSKSGYPLTNKNATKKTPVFDQPVDYNLAMGCVAMYQHVYFNAANPDSIAKAYTESISFGSKNLSDWAADIAANTNAVKTKICFGIYTQDMVAANPILKPGRLTVFLFPVDINGNRAIYIKNSTYSSPTYNGTFLKPLSSPMPTPPYNVGNPYP